MKALAIYGALVVIGTIFLPNNFYPNNPYSSSNMYQFLYLLFYLYQPYIIACLVSPRLFPVKVSRPAILALWWGGSMSILNILGEVVVGKDSFLYNMITYALIPALLIWAVSLFFVWIFKKIFGGN